MKKSLYQKKLDAVTLTQEEITIRNERVILTRQRQIYKSQSTDDENIRRMIDEQIEKITEKIARLDEESAKLIKVIKHGV